MAPSDELEALAKILADWASPAPGATLYLFGSRVRGDHKQASDVDVSVEFKAATDAEVTWWAQINDDLFAIINSRLPGPLQILEEDDPVTAKVRSSPVVYRDRNVACVRTEPKQRP